MILMKFYQESLSGQTITTLIKESDNSFTYVNTSREYDDVSYYKDLPVLYHGWIYGRRWSVIAETENEVVICLDEVDEGQPKIVYKNIISKVDYTINNINTLNKL